MALLSGLLLLLNRLRQAGGPPSPENVRLTEEGDFRITEEGDFRQIDG